jgi:hypothetical protein
MGPQNKKGRADTVCFPYSEEQLLCVFLGEYTHCSLALQNQEFILTVKRFKDGFDFAVFC